MSDDGEAWWCNLTYLQATPNYSVPNSGNGQVKESRTVSELILQNADSNEVIRDADEMGIA